MPVRSRRTQIERSLRQNWIEVDSGAICHNVKVLKDRIGPSVAMFATLKSNACGFGLEEAGSLLEREGGVHGMALVDPGDAFELRKCGITKPILIFGGALLDAELVTIAVEERCILTAHDPESLGAILSSDSNVEFVVEFNVGAERLGFFPKDAASIIAQVRNANHAKLVGATAHMYVPRDTRAASAVAEQYDRFLEILKVFRKTGVALRYELIASSQTMLASNEMNLTAVDPGHLIFGITTADSSELAPQLRSALRAVKSRLVHIHEVGYAGNASPFSRSAGMRVAVFPFGASDGLMRIHCGHVLLHGTRAPILAINAEHTIIDITHLPSAAVGDEIVIVGAQRSERITIEEIEVRYPGMRSRADVTRNISPFIPRCYVDVRPSTEAR